mmetsp:Transcript_8702/g.15868  ORF Transcript_8702/g.15868 Transcript_8702/m.15868 type:complete len:84 (+) Transcript_8702:110-361(+)
MIEEEDDSTDDEQGYIEESAIQELTIKNERKWRFWACRRHKQGGSNLDPPAFIGSKEPGTSLGKITMEFSWHAPPCRGDTQVL